MRGYEEMLDAGSGLMPFRWAAERLERARSYWLATTRPDGRPHAMPVWGIWLDGRLWFSTGHHSRKAHNLAASPACVVFPESADEAVIIEGTAERVTDPATLARFKEFYGAKYHWDLDLGLGPIFAVRPHVAFGFIESPNPDKGSPTRWVF
jgi:hypothetical protein